MKKIGYNGGLSCPTRCSTDIFTWILRLCSEKTPVVYSVMNQEILRVLLQLACEDTRSFHISTDLISTTIHTSRGAYPHFFVVRRQVQKNNKTQPNLRFGTDNNIRLSFTTLTSSNSQTIQWFTTVVRVRGLSLEDEYPSIV